MGRPKRASALRVVQVRQKILRNLNKTPPLVVSGDQTEKDKQTKRPARKRTTSGKGVSKGDLAEIQDITVEEQAQTSAKKSKMQKGKVVKTKAVIENTRSSPDLSGPSFEERNNFVSMDMSGSLTDPSDVEGENAVGIDPMLTPQRQRCRESQGSQRPRPSPKTTGSRDQTCSDHDEDQSRHVEVRATPKELTRAELQETRETLNVIQQFMLKKGLIDSSMTREEVMEFMTKGSNSESESVTGRSAAPRVKSRKHVKQTSAKRLPNPGKELLNNSPSETTIYKGAVQFKQSKKPSLPKPTFDKGLMPRGRKSSSSDGPIDTSDELLDNEGDINPLHFLTDPKRYSHDNGGTTSDSRSRSRSRSAHDRITSRSRSPSSSSSCSSTESMEEEVTRDRDVSHSLDHRARSRERKHDHHRSRSRSRSRRKRRTKSRSHSRHRRR